MRKGGLLARRGAGGVPTMVGPPSISGTVAVGQVLTVSDGAYVGLEPRSISRQWMRGAATVLGGATGQTYTPVVGDQASTLKCRVTVANILGALSVDTPNTIVVP